jgi:hypothetical protein
MQPNNCNPSGNPALGAVGEEDCPKCGAAMEPVEIEVEELPIQQLRLCPECYLVTWNDASGFHSRQGVPMKKGFDPASDPVEDDLMEDEPIRQRREPPVC